MRTPNPGEILWSEALVERLSELWLAGITGGEIGHRLGISRCAVMGKLRRLGLLGAGRRMPARLLKTTEQVSKPKPRPKRANRRPLPPPEPYQAPPPPPPPAYGTLNLLDLRHNSCRWPEGSRPDYRFCGRPRHHESSYCETHSTMAHSRGSQRDYDRAAEQALGGKLFASPRGGDGMRLVPYAGTERHRPRRMSDKDRRAALLANIFERQEQARLLSEIGAEFRDPISVRSAVLVWLFEAAA